MMALKLFLLFVLNIMYVQCLYISEDGKLKPINVQLYNAEENFRPGHLTRQNMEYMRTARVQPEQTVIVVPNQGVGSVSRQPYGTYGSSASRGPTVIVNVPDEYNRVITDPYRRY